MRRKHWFSKGFDLRNLFPGELNGSSKTFPINKNDFFDKQLKPSEHLVLIESGKISFTRSDKNGKTINIGSVIAGEVFGEVKLRIDSTAFTIAYAEEDSYYRVFPRKVINDLFLSVAAPVYELTVGSIFKESITTKIQDFLYLDPTAKLARLFLDRAEQKGNKTSRGIQIDLPASVEVLCRLTGNDTQAATLGLGFLYGQKLIAIDKGRIYINDSKGLQYWSQ